VRLRANKHPVTCQALCQTRSIARLRAALSLVQAEFTAAQQGLEASTPGRRLVIVPEDAAPVDGLPNPDPSPEAMGFAEGPPDSGPPSEDEDYPSDGVQAEVALGWGFAAGLDSAFDD
jgi:hypothetical protein